MTEPVYVVVSCVVPGQDRMKNRAAACPSAVVDVAEECACAAAALAGRSLTVQHSRQRGGKLVVEDQRMAGHLACRMGSCCRAFGRMLSCPR